jgi:hypothetical protein
MHATPVPCLAAIFEYPGHRFLIFMINYTHHLPGRHLKNPGRVGFMIHATNFPCLAAILKILEG